MTQTATPEPSSKPSDGPIQKQASQPADVILGPLSPPWVKAVPPWEAISAVPSVAANPLATPLLPATRQKSPPPRRDGFPVRPLPPLDIDPAPHGSPAPQQPPQAPPRERPAPERPQPQRPPVERDRNADPPPPPPQARNLPNPCATFNDFRSGPCNAVLNRLNR